MAPKSKSQKMSLGDFLGDQSLGSWADEMEDMPVASDSRTGYGDRRAFSSAAGFGDRGGFDRSERTYTPREQLPLPTKPPYTAHLGNLPFDATNYDIEEFFSGCEVTNIRIVEDKIERRPKGFGYVEYASLDGLKRALDLNMTQFQGRNIKISVADPPKDRPEARELNDWTRKGPLPDLPQQQQQQRRASDRGGSFKNYDAPDMERGGSRRGVGGAPAEGNGKVRDFGNWERKGPLSPGPAPGPMRDGGRVRGPPNNSNNNNQEAGPRERKLSPSWGEGRSQDGSRPPRGEFRERPQAERQPTAAELDTQWRARMRSDAPTKSGSPTPEPSTPTSPAQSSAPATRPKLNLAKRTVSEAIHDAPVSAGDSSSSPFGGARPIDTATREREVEEKRQIALQAKKEAEDKAREEKRAKETAAKAAAAEAEVEKTIDDEKSQNEGNENGSESPQAGKRFQILSRLNDQEGEKEAAADVEADTEAGSKAEPTKVDTRGEARRDSKSEVRGANGSSNPSERRGSRRGEFSKDHPPRGPRNTNSSSWRRKPSNTQSPGGNNTPTTENAEEDGWSTVPAKGKGSRGRGGNQPTRTTTS